MEVSSIPVDILLKISGITSVTVSGPTMPLFSNVGWWLVPRKGKGESTFGCSNRYFSVFLWKEDRTAFLRTNPHLGSRNDQDTDRNPEKTIRVLTCITVDCGFVLVASNRYSKASFNRSRHRTSSLCLNLIVLMGYLPEEARKSGPITT